MTDASRFAIDSLPRGVSIFVSIFVSIPTLLSVIEYHLDLPKPRIYVLSGDAVSLTTPPSQPDWNHSTACSRGYCAAS